MVEREIGKMSRLLLGIQQLKKLPDAIFVASSHHDDIAIREARKSRVKIIGLVDSNADPSQIDCVIPCNDDAIAAVNLVVNYLADAILEGKNRYSSEPAISANNLDNDNANANNLLAVDVSAVGVVDVTKEQQ